MAGGVVRAAVVVSMCGWLAAAAAARSSLSGTWVGNGVPPSGVKTWNGIPICQGAAAVGCISRDYLALIEYRFTFSGTRADYYGEGPTSASHDAFDAVGWCRMRWNLDHENGGWSYYRAAGVGRWSHAAAGPSVECQEQPVKYAIWWVRIRQAGARLKFQFAEDNHTGEPVRYETALYLKRAS